MITEEMADNKGYLFRISPVEIISNDKTLDLKDIVVNYILTYG